MSKGIFVTFEGGEGTGKSTQIAILARKLEARGLEVLCAREPGGVKLSEYIRALLLDPEIEAMDSITELMLYNASRREIVQKLIIPALEEYDVILMDRFYDSTTAYQGYARDLNLELVRILISAAVGELKPQLTVLLDIDPSLGVQRAKGVAVTRFELESIAFHERVRQGFLQIAMDEPDRVVVIDATPSIEEVALKVEEAFNSHYKEVQDGRR